MRSLARGGLLGAVLLAGLPSISAAQVFLASRPHPPYTVGPLYVLASVSPEMSELPIDISWSLVLSTSAQASDAEGDLFLLWPSALIPVANLGPPDPALTRYVEERGFVSIEEGRAELSTRKFSTTAERK